MSLVDDKLFLELIKKESFKVLQLADFITEQKDRVLNRSFLSRYYSETLRIEELLDYYGAQNNKKWFIFRKYIAAAKWFSKITYNIIHIQNSISAYNLLDLKRDFRKETDEIVFLFTRGIKRISLNLLKEAVTCKIKAKHKKTKSMFIEERIPGKLPANRKLRNVASYGETVVYLVSNLLNLSEKCKEFRNFQKLSKKEYASCFPEIISEEKLRLIENRFHNLQSLYDTYISDTNIESKDHDLAIIRGHVSVIYHLLESATDCAHVYERHMKKEYGEPLIKLPMNKPELLNVIVDYFITYTLLFIESAKGVSHTILKKYAEQGQITVNVPNFRGFHVRPSTLISKIIHHYGSEVYLRMNNQIYNAASPLELFRVNEEINAHKRKKLAIEIEAVCSGKRSESESEKGARKILREILFKMLEKKKIILYENYFTFDTLQRNENESLSEYIKRGIAQCLAFGYIDIHTDLKVTFTGDKRVLSDIRVLAETGYGEDNFGNNIVLPKALSYLR